MGFHHRHTCQPRPCPEGDDVEAAPRAFRPGEDVNDFTLCFSGLVQQLAWHDDYDNDEQKPVEKYLRVVPKKYTQITLSMETLLNLSTLSIEEVTAQLKAMGNHEEALPANPVSTDSKLLFTEEQWLAR
jgi:hypothetical protein